MTIPQPNDAADSSFDSLFEQAFAQLFTGLPEKRLQENTPAAFCDLANLFDAQSAFSELKPELVTENPDRVSALPSDAEMNTFWLDKDEETALGFDLSSDLGSDLISDLGSDLISDLGSDLISDLSSDETDLAAIDALFPPEDPETSPDSLAQELNHWLSPNPGLPQNLGIVPETVAMRRSIRNLATAPGQNDEDLSKLKSLLTVESEFSPTQSARSAIAYLGTQPWQGLEALIAQPAKDTLPLPIPSGLFTDLEALIDAPVQVSAQPPTQLLTQSSTVTKTVEPGLQDLEYLIQEARRTLGGTPILSGAGGTRSTLRSRSPKAKIFEQTMRVPVKQLDNVSNLIGELVIKRNRLEQDQERLRQFLDNLLSQVQHLSDVGGRMQDLYERTLLEGALLATGSPKPIFVPSVSSNALRPSLSEASSEIDTASSPANPNEEGWDALEMDRFTGFHLLSQEMIELIVRVRESASDIQFLVDETERVSRSLRQVTDQLQEGMTQSRMVPFTQAADRLPRAIRDISLRLNKQVKLQVEGKSVLIDKVILEHLYNPMTHLVNNAITHGIESPSLRQQLGKNPIGRITIRTFLQGNQTVITVADDGAGIDTEKVKAKAVEKGLITAAEAKGYSQLEVFDLLFHPGFSTKDKVDDFSGRGVGLDVVRTSLSEIRGLVTIDSVKGQGTTFTIRLPLTLSICQALCCLNDQARIAFPMDGVEDMREHLVSDLPINEAHQRCVRWNNTLLPIHPLKELLVYHHPLHRGTVYGSPLKQDTISVVILQGAGNFIAIQVDQVIGEEEIVIKQIEGPIPKPMGITGTTVQGDGRIMPIADVLELIELAQGRMRIDNGTSFWQKTLIQTVQETIREEITVLIVDDSITVRELLSLRFSKAGYRVEQARDGQEAWAKLQAGMPCHIVFCDIEMPNMNGLELLSHLQKDKRLSAIPFAVLTSRSDDSHRQMASQLGASGYFTKPYTEKDLLDAAQRMIRGEVLLLGSSRASRYPRVNRPRTVPPARSAARIPLDKKKEEPLVLIVDDSVMAREMLSMTFSNAGYRVEQARDGQEAWEKLQGQLRCDLILCDIEMPRMNGLELLSRLQDDDRFSSIPVAMITSRGAQKMQRIAAEKGAKGYFVKPYLEDVLLSSSQRLIAGEVLIEMNSPGES